MNIDELSEAIFGEVSSFKEEVDEIMKEEIDVLSNEALKKLKKAGNFENRTGKYRKSFRLKKLADGMGYKRNQIYNKKYQLTHLLEKGHLTANGTKRTQAYPHWEQAEEMAATLPERIARRLRE